MKRVMVVMLSLGLAVPAMAVAPAPVKQEQKQDSYLMYYINTFINGFLLLTFLGGAILVVLLVYDIIKSTIDREIDDVVYRIGGQWTNEKDNSIDVSVRIGCPWLNTKEV